MSRVRLEPHPPIMESLPLKAGGYKEHREKLRQPLESSGESCLLSFLVPFVQPSRLCEHARWLPRTETVTDAAITTSWLETPITQQNILGADLMPDTELGPGDEEDMALAPDLSTNTPGLTFLLQTGDCFS